MHYLMTVVTDTKPTDKDLTALMVEFKRREAIVGNWNEWSVGGRYANFLLGNNGQQYDSLMKGDIDVGTMEVTQVKDAEDYWELVRGDGKITQIMIDAHVPICDAVVANGKWGGDWSIDQPLYGHIKPSGHLSARGLIEMADDLVLSKDDYVEYSRLAAISTYGILKDEKWVGRGCPDGSELLRPEWASTYRKVWDTIRDDQWITMVDIHR